MLWLRRVKGKGIFRKTGLTLAPVNREAREIVSAIKEQHTVLVEVWEPRNMRAHRLYFAMLNNVVEATGKWVSSEHLRRDILLSLGRYDEHVNQLTGEVTKVVHSMAVASMPKDDFDRLLQDTIKLLTEALGCDPTTLMEEPA